MNNINKIAIELLKIAQDYNAIIKKIKLDLNNLYKKLNLSRRFDSLTFNLYEVDDKIIIDIPMLSTSKNELFLKNLLNKSMDIIIKDLRNIGINTTKKDFKYMGRMRGPFSALTYYIIKNI